jgi:hypothetical protein
MPGGPSPGVSAIEVRLAAGCPQPHCRSPRFDLPRDVAPSRQARSAHDRAAVVPELPGSLDRIEAGVPPPGGFIAYAVHQSMMDSRERHRELVARLATVGCAARPPRGPDWSKLKGGVICIFLDNGLLFLDNHSGDLCSRSAESDARSHCADDYRASPAHRSCGR